MDKDIKTLKQYLSEDEIKEIIRDKFEETIVDKCRNNSDLERLIQNAFYNVIIDKIDKLLEEQWVDLEDKIRKWFERFMKNKNDFRYEMFYRSSYWMTTSYLVKLIDEITRENRDIVEWRVKELINEMDKEYIWDSIIEVIKWFFKKNLDD